MVHFMELWEFSRIDSTGRLERQDTTRRCGWCLDARAIRPQDSGSVPELMLVVAAARTSGER